MGLRWSALPGLLAALALLGGCAAKRPVLYPNETLKTVGWDGAQRDVDECIAFSESYGRERNPALQTAGSTAAGGAVGGAVGGAGGAVWGDPGRRAGFGAAAGATAGFFRGLFRWRDPDPIQARFVGVCLAQQGYRVIGWR
jgi:hypothetical protein